MCPVWYDEFSLSVGDSLRESIEGGLKSCGYCILVLTPNFLSKGGWPKREYDSIFTREVIEDERLILPVWHNVSKQEVMEYSASLADKLARSTATHTVEEIAEEIAGVIKGDGVRSLVHSASSS